jgi:glutamyl-tRNA reductase
MITKKSFVSARYIDEAKENIEILLKDGDIIRPHIIEHDEASKDFKDLIKMVSVDDLHEKTVNHNREQREAFEESIKIIAENEGLSFKNLKQDEIFDMVIDALQEEHNEESLFRFKLKIFDIPSVKESKSRKIKADIRKATSITEAIVEFSKI